MPVLSRPAPTRSRRPCRRATSLRRPVAPRRRGDDALRRPRPLAVYSDERGRRRELLALPARGGSTLVLDRDAATLCDRRLVAHLGAEEPAGNAALVCRLYLEDPSGRWCRALCPEDLRATPAGEAAEAHPPGSRELEQTIEAGAHLYGLRLVAGERSTSQLRWCRCARAREQALWEQISLREVVAALESYEPMRTLTAHAIACRSGDSSVALTRLSSEYERLCASPIVLNRRLREAVGRAIERDGISMSEIALRCGVVKRDSRGRASGETSWLARRVGLMPEGGAKATTPWVHSDVLALIARRGLRVSPREVEVQ